MSDFSITAICPYCHQRFAPDDGDCCSLCDECMEVIYRSEQRFIYKINGKKIFMCGSCADEYDRFINGESIEED